MKSNLMKKTFAALAFGTLSLMATGAQADGYRSYGHNPVQVRNGGHEINSGRAHQDRRAFQQSARFRQQINARQDRQMGRIKAGMRSGALTRGEFRGLMHEQHEIRTMERHFKTDGLIDAREFQRLDRALNVASHNILDEKHDRQARNAYGHTPRFN